eukprot:symbB.v1.2.002911.t1/scaffold160.1/size429097/2
MPQISRRRNLLPLALALVMLLEMTRWMSSFVMPPSRGSGADVTHGPAQMEPQVLMASAVSSVLLTPLPAAAGTWPNDFWDYMTILMGVATCGSTLGYLVYDWYFREKPGEGMP